MAQESTFTAEIRSSANAYGLMQVIPRHRPPRRARSSASPRFTTAMLTQPETNVRIGMKYFKDMVDAVRRRALRAGRLQRRRPHRVARWLEEAPGLPQDEFIDNIPFPETQTYVKRILGTAEDYRRLYGGGLRCPLDRTPAQRLAGRRRPDARTAPARSRALDRRR